MTAATLDLPERYTRPHLLGRGAVSAVYRAHDRLLGRDVALKILQWDDERLTARLMREARVQGQLDHPSICKIYDSGTHRGQAFIAMELIDGVELGALTLPLTELLRLVAEIADALHVAHAAGLVHRDIKPTHIVVERLADDRPRPVLIDFGLVHEMPSASDTLTEARDTIGTPAFMAPEQIRAGAAVDARADVYALGATLYALLAGHPPFDDDAGDDDGAEPPSSLEIMRRTLNSAPTPLRRLNPAVPARVAQLVHACLEKQPDDRPPSAAALAEDLRRLARGDLSVHRTPSLTTRLRRSLRRPTRRRAAIALVAMLVVGAMIIGLQQWRDARRLHYAQRFGQLGGDFARTLRAEVMSAPRDLGPSRDRLRSRLRAIEDELDAIGALGRGPAHGALGRGHLALGEYDRARHHLERAWEAGDRSPETAYALGMALAWRYAEVHRQASQLTGSTRRAVALARLETETRQRAIALLRHGRDAVDAAPEYVEAQIAFVEGDLDTALARLDRAQDGRPWLYEAPILRGDILAWRASIARDRSDMDTARANLETAAQAYEQASASAGSAIEAWLGRARVAMLRFMVDAIAGLDPAIVEAHMREARAHCQQARALDPDDHRSWIADSTNAILLGVYRHSLRGQPILPLLREAETLARWVLVRNQPPWTTAAGRIAYSEAQRVLGHVQSRTAAHHVWGQRGEDPRPFYDLAAVALHRALQATRHQHAAIRLRLAKVHSRRTQHEAGYGADPLMSAQRSLGMLQPLLAQAPDDPELRYESGLSWTQVAAAQYVRGENPAVAIDRALAHYRHLVDAAPNNPRVHVQTADLLAQRAWHRHRLGRSPGDDLARVAERLAAADALDPGDPFVWAQSVDIQLALAHLALARGDDPLPALRAAIARLNTPHPLARASDPAHNDLRHIRLGALLLRAALLDDDALPLHRAHAARRAEALQRTLTAPSNGDARQLLLRYLLWMRYAQRVTGDPSVIRSDLVATGDAQINTLLTDLPRIDASRHLWRGVWLGLRDPETNRADAALDDRVGAAFDRAVRANVWLTEDADLWRCRLRKLAAGSDGPRLCAPRPASART